MGVAGPTCVVSPHLLVAQAVAAALRSAGTSAEARSWESFVHDPETGSREIAPDEQHPLVVILDGLDNADVVQDVARLVRDGRTRVMVVTTAEASVLWGGLVDEDLLDVTTASSVQQLAEVVDRIRAGGTALDPAGRVALRVSWVQALDRRHHVTELIESLSPQQRRVLELLASGLRVAEVGTEMGVTRGTVRSHVKALRAKLGARTQLEAVAMLHEAYAAGVGANLVPRPRQAYAGTEVPPRR
ncbi:DNA-binding response regulator, NarL/FixJ family, contains REC and HTH domains [Nocardioides alpinus]|nr:LuxR C-terminal-related transcriptional regulator [Nocardioides alpinus]SFA78856.1 DNA-binding response regulator, NarL/FixJ family, contains REC and HTH domains [Nocardioides alpinus]